MLSYEAAASELAEAKDLNKESPGAIPAGQLRRLELAAQLKQLDVTHAQTLLDLAQAAREPEEGEAGENDPFDGAEPAEEGEAGEEGDSPSAFGATE